MREDRRHRQLLALPSVHAVISAATSCLGAEGKTSRVCKGYAPNSGAGLFPWPATVVDTYDVYVTMQDNESVA